MSTLTSNNIENHISAYHKDGLTDLFVGFAIFFAGLFLWTEMVWMAAIFIPVLTPSFQAARKRFLEPRIGELPQSSQQQAQNQKVVLWITLLLGVLFLAGIGMFFAYGVMSGPLNDWLRNYFLLVIGVVFASVWLFAAAMLKINRFYLYGAFTFATLAAAQFTALPFWIALAILGGLIILLGTIILIRFMQQNPKMPHES
jgi:MFS family permease